MKFIFVMAIAFVVGAQRNNDRMNNTMNNMNDTMNGMNDTMNGMNDTMYDMYDMDDMNNTHDMNHTMHGGGGCGMPGHHRGVKVISKMFFKKITRICMDVRFPREMYKQCKHCMKDEAKKSPIVDNMLKGKFPEKRELGKFIESVEICKLKAGGINDLQRDLTIDKLLKALMVEKWRGNQQDKETLKQKMTECFNQAQGNGYQKMINYHKCVTDFLLEECSRKDKEPGLMLILSSKLLTLGDESKCSPVKVPQDVKQIRDRCFEQVKMGGPMGNDTDSMNNSSNSMNNSSNSMNNSSNSMNNSMNNFGSSNRNSNRGSSSSNMWSSNKSGSRDSMKGPMKLVKHFWKDCMMKAVECFLTELKMFDTQKETINVTGMVDYVKKFEGWNGIERERDQVLSAITECGKSFEEDSEDSGESKNSSMSSMMHSQSSEEDYHDIIDKTPETPEDKKMKEMMEDKMKFEKCFTPKFSKICGINNELANFFYPMLDPEFMAAVFKAFMESGGKEAEDMINMLKEKLKE